MKPENEQILNEIIDELGLFFSHSTEEDIKQIADMYCKKQLLLHNVSSMFSAEQMEKAFNDGAKAEQQRCGEFNIENYC
jgi:hypothetical protein